MNKIKLLAATSLAAIFLTACGDENDAEKISVDFEAVEHNLEEEHSYMNVLNDDKTPDEQFIIKGKTNTLTLSDFEKLLYTPELLNTSITNSIISELLIASYPPSEEDVNAFILEQSEYLEEQGQSDFDIRERDAYNYIALIKAGYEILGVTEEEKEAFYTKYLDKEVYPTLESVPNIESEIMFNKLTEPTELAKLYKKIIENHSEFLATQDLKIQNFNLKKQLESYVASGLSSSLLTKYAANEILKKPNNEVLFELNDKKITVEDVKDEIVYSNSYDVLSRFVVYESVISKNLTENELSGLEELEKIWTSKYDSYDSSSLDVKMYRDFVYALYVKLSNEGKINNDILKAFHESKTTDSKDTNGNNYYYADVEFEKIPKVDLAYEYFLENNSISDFSNYKNDIDLKALEFYDDKVFNLVEKTLKNL